MSSIPTQQKRINLIRDIIKKYECDAFLSFCPIDNRYLSGFSGSTSVVLITRENCFFLSDFRYKEQTSNEVFNFSISIVSGNLDNKLLNIVKSNKIKKIAVNTEKISLRLSEDLRKKGRFELIDAREELSQLRILKDTNEIDNIRQACKITEMSVFHCTSFLKEGVTEREISARIDYEFRINGADGSAFDTIVLFGKNSSLPHGKPGDKKLSIGDIVLIDCGCLYKGYCSDLTRTFVYGAIPGTWFTEIYETVLSAQINALKALTPEKKTNEIDHIARRYISGKGMGTYFGHGLGHGVGMEIHEPPRLNTDSSTTLKEGFVITIEPGIYIPGKGGVRIEDTVLITKDGYERLTTSDKYLKVLPL
ncbi:MAG: M24 family metallopeptidase [Candidatus Hydrogenedens sp.]